MQAILKSAEKKLEMFQEQWLAGTCYRKGGIYGVKNLLSILLVRLPKQSHTDAQETGTYD